MMNPVSEEVLKDYKDTLRAKNLKHIEGVALMTPLAADSGVRAGPGAPAQQNAAAA
jgi:hypothetical protein